MTYDKKVKEIREKANMTLAEAAKKWQMGKTTLYRIESGEMKKVPKKQLEKIAKANNIPIEYFTTTIYDKYPPEVAEFLTKKDARNYILKAYYLYKADKALGKE